MDLVAQILLTSIVWGPALLVLYWVIRLAVRHGMEDAQRIRQGDRKRAEISETIRRHQATYGGSAPE
ncbi:hypothetical protein [Nocardioides lacusdianchii]|uniref:hypothetical protein n=1 Tax=Nocardioides lacusdianchii TaxID=2783664 RepID=UPI001CC993C1|nr:hypothetical protein [Nocardioides lacusdianchii]